MKNTIEIKSLDQLNRDFREHVCETAERTEVGHEIYLCHYLDSATGEEVEWYDDDCVGMIFSFGTVLPERIV